MMALFTGSARAKAGGWHTSLLESQIFMLDFQAPLPGERRGGQQEGTITRCAMTPIGLYPTQTGSSNYVASWGRLWERS